MLTFSNILLLHAHFRYTHASTAPSSWGYNTFFIFLLFSLFSVTKATPESILNVYLFSWLECSSSKHSYEISYELLDGSFEEKRLGKLIIGILLNNLSKINTKFVSY